MKKYSIEEIKKWISHFDPIFSGPDNILADLKNFGEKTIDDANAEEIKNAHTEMDEEDQEEDLEGFVNTSGAEPY